MTKNTNKFLLIAVLVIALFMVLSTLGTPVYGTGSAQKLATQPAVQPVSAASAISAVPQPGVQTQSAQPAAQPGLRGTVMNMLQNAGNNTNRLFLPNINNAASVTNGLVQPLYTRAPAPMGIGYLGVQSNHGRMTGTVLKTSSFVGTISLSNISVYNLANDGPDQFTIQLNTVLANTTLFGSSNYSFWTQNVILYTTTTHQLSFEDNIWNFSSPSAYLSSNAIYSSTGLEYPYPGVHIAAGPTFTVNFPFTVSLYLNSTLIDGRNAVYFNYSIPTIGQSGTYDQVIFNSTYGMPQGYSAPQSDFMVNAFQMAPVGLPYDAELMLGGPGGGSTNSVYAVNGSMTLQYLAASRGESHFHRDHGFRDNGYWMMGRDHSRKPSSSYVNVPAAYNFGTDTGETSEGMTVSWTPNAVAHLYAGPSLLYGMWNLSRTNMMMHFSGSVEPSNAFMFVSQGFRFNQSSAEWAPLTQSGTYNFVLPFGFYSAAYMLSYYNPVYLPLFARHVELHKNPMTGIYTPLFAENNAQVANISTSGNGSPGNPYVLDNMQYGPINPLFSEFNDFAFPVFAGVMLSNTDVNIVMESMPNLMVTYLPAFSSPALPSYNYMGYWLYHVDNATIWNSPFISGWFYAALSGFPVGNIILWDSSNILVANNTFQSMGSSMVVFGGTGNTIFGNYFLNAVTNFTPLQSIYTNLFGGNLGLSMYSSGNLIYNNYFNTEFTAYSPPQNPYNGNFQIYTDTWNVSLRPASSSSMVNGFNLTGSIVGGQYEGGNYWWNFNGLIPYNDNLLIAAGGDYIPLNGLMPVADPSGGISNNSAISAVPNPQVPDTTPVVVPLFSDFVVTHWCPTYTATVNIPAGTWASIVLVYNGSASGVVYDSGYSLVMNNVTVFTGTSPEYGNWSVEANLTAYTALLQGGVNFTFSPPMAIINGSFNNSMELLLYPVAPGSQAPSEPNVIIPLGASSTVNVPYNVTAAKLNLLVYGFGADEFWYADMPSIQPYRDINVSVDGMQIASVLPFPYINTGGIDNFMWRPVTGVFTLNDRPYVVNVTAALGMLEGTHSMSISVEDLASGWTTDGALMLYTSNTAGPASQLFYSNSPATPFTLPLPTPDGTTYVTMANSSYAYMSVIPTATGYIEAEAVNQNSFLNEQAFSSNGVWQNITQLETTLNLYATQVMNDGTVTNITTLQLLLFPLTMDTGFEINATGSSYPISGTFSEYLYNLSQAWEDETVTTVQQGANLSAQGTILLNQVQATNGVTAGNLTLTSPYAGVINSVSKVSSEVANFYYYATYNLTMVTNVYSHLVIAETSDGQPPNYQGTVVVDNVWVLHDLPLAVLI